MAGRELMPAKKKRTHKLPTVTLRKKTLDALRLLGEEFEPYVEKANGWRTRMEAAEKKLAVAQQISAAQSDTMADRAMEITDLAEQLKRTERAYDAEVAFWKKEVEHLQQRAVDAVLSAVKK